MRLLGLVGVVLLGCSGASFGSGAVDGAGGEAVEAGTTSGGTVAVTARGGSSAGSGPVVKNQDPEGGSAGEAGMESGGSGGALHGGSAGTTGSGGSTPGISGSSTGGSAAAGSGGQQVGGSAGSGPTGPVGDVCELASGSMHHDCSAEQLCKPDSCGLMASVGTKFAPRGLDRTDRTIVLDPEAPVETQWCNKAPSYSYNLSAPTPVCVRVTAQPGSGMTFSPDRCGEYTSGCLLLTGNQVGLSVSAPVATSWLRVEIAGLRDPDTNETATCPFTCEEAQ